MLGYRLVSTSTEPRVDSMDRALYRILQRNHTFHTVVDIGASNGCWTESLMKYFPQCEYLLVEAQPLHEAALVDFVSKHNNAQFVLAAAGEAKGEIFFEAGDPIGGQASYVAYPANNIVVPVTTVDDEIRSRGLPGPFLLKFDTHGFEVPILNGAAQTLSDTEVIVMECYNFNLAPECLLFYQMCDHLQSLGFRCIDLVDPLHREHDGSFWQADLVFVRANRPEFSYTRYI